MSLTVGPVIDKREKPVVNPKPLRDVEEYKGSPPTSNEGKTPIAYNISEKCNLKDDRYKGGRCQQTLMVARLKNTKFEWDTTHTGGQLMYDDEDVKQFKYCPIHGPNPVGPSMW